MPEVKIREMVSIGEMQFGFVPDKGTADAISIVVTVNLFLSYNIMTHKNMRRNINK